jgi:hypothetical protein
MSKTYWVAVSLVAALALFVGGFVLVGDNTRTTDPRGVVPVAAATMVDMNGTWNQTDESSITMTATITGGKISIDMNTGDTSGVYWLGTFPVGKILADGFTVTSAGDTQAMESDLYASQDSTKTFTYKNGVLSFQFSILGTTRTVHLQRSAE